MSRIVIPYTKEMVRLRNAKKKESSELGKEQDQNSRDVGCGTESLTKKSSESHKYYCHR